MTQDEKLFAVARAKEDQAWATAESLRGDIRRLIDEAPRDQRDLEIIQFALHLVIARITMIQAETENLPEP